MPDEFVVPRVQFAGRIMRNFRIDACDSDQQRVFAGEVKNLGRIGQDDEKVFVFRIVRG